MINPPIVDPRTVAYWIRYRRRRQRLCRRILAQRRELREHRRRQLGFSLLGVLGHMLVVISDVKKMKA